MDEALEKNIPVIYISLGTMVKWQDWYVEVFYEGLKRIKCRVICLMLSYKELFIVLKMLVLLHLSSK